LSHAHLEKNRSYLKGLVVHKGSATGVRPQVAGTIENNNAIEAGLFTRLKSGWLHVWSSNTPVYRRTNRICRGHGRFGSFIANDGETVSSAYQPHMENKSQFSESLGTPHRAW
jgi:hypothetical protein